MLSNLHMSRRDKIFIELITTREPESSRDVIFSLLIKFRCIFQSIYPKYYVPTGLKGMVSLISINITSLTGLFLAQQNVIIRHFFITSSQTFTLIDFKSLISMFVK